MQAISPQEEGSKLVPREINVPDGYIPISFVNSEVTFIGKSDFTILSHQSAGQVS